MAGKLPGRAVVGSVRRRPSVSPPSRRKTSTASDRNAPTPFYQGPWILMAMVGIVGQLLFLLWSETSGFSKFCAHAGVILATLIVAYSGYVTTNKRTWASLAHTVATILATGAWLELCSWTGLVHLVYSQTYDFTLPKFQHPTLDIFLLLGGTAAVAWNIRQTDRVNESTAASARNSIDNDDPNDPWVQAGLPGVKGNLKKVNEFKLKGTIYMPPGTTVEVVQGHIPTIESVFNYPRKSMTIMPGIAGKMRQAQAEVMLKDPLAEDVVWDGVHLGRRPSLMDFLVPTGRDANGDGAGVFIVTKDGTKHHLVQGMSGSGKTHGENPVLLYCAAMGATQVVIDTQKKTQSYGPLAPALHGLIIDPRQARAFLKRLSDNIIPARTEQLAREGLQQWSPKSKLKLLRVQIEEAWALIDSDALMGIAVSARSAGVQLTISLQRASHDQISTTVRDQLGTRRCYGIKGNFGLMVLDDEVLEAGADPTKWGDEHPGMHYMQRKGLSIEQKATPIRSFNDNGSISFIDSAEYWGPRLHAWDDVTTGALGSMWDNWVTPVELVRSLSSAVPGAATGAALSQMSSGLVVPDQTLIHPAMQHGVEVAPVVPPEGDFGAGVVAVAQEYPPLSVVPDDAGSEEEEKGTVQFFKRGMVLRNPGLEDLEITFDEDDDLEDAVYPENGEIPARPSDRPPKQLGIPNAEAVSREVFDQKLNARVEELRAAGKSEFAFSDLTAVYMECKWSRGAIYKRLGERADLVKLDGNQGWMFAKR